MSKKLFSLLYGDNVHIAPKTKIVPRDTFSKALDIEEMLAHVKQEEIKYRKDVVAECEKLKEHARNEGFEAGYQEWAEQLATLEAEIIKVRQELEKLLAPVALKAAQKIVGRQIDLSEDTIIDIVSNVLKSVAQHKKIAIYTNPKDLEILEANRPRLKDIFETLEALSLRPREDISPGGCIIETEGGIINARLENQWKVLERAFETMFKGQTLESLTKEVKKEKE